jgi:hypothetical protein
MRQGNIGAGTGATVGKVRGLDFAMKGGLGIAFASIGDAVWVAALAVVNAWGDIVDFRTGQLVAGARNRATGEWLDTAKVMLRGEVGWGFQPMLVGENTTLVCVVTDAGLTKVQATKAAQWAQNGLALAIPPTRCMTATLPLSLPSGRSGAISTPFASPSNTPSPMPSSTPSVSPNLFTASLLSVRGNKRLVSRTGMGFLIDAAQVGAGEAGVNLRRR